MSNGKNINSKKSSLQEAKASFEEIKKFARQNAKKELEAELSKKVDAILKESISINTSNDGRDDVLVNDKLVNDLDEVSRAGLQTYATDLANGARPITGREEDMEKEEESLDEIITLENEDQLTPAPEVPAAPEAEMPVAPEEEIAVAPEAEFETPAENNIDTIAQELTKNLVDLVTAATAEETPVETVDIIDDEASVEEPIAAAPVPEAPAAPAPEVPAAPLAEDEDLLEFTLEEITGEETVGEDGIANGIASDEEEEMIFEFDDETFKFNPDSDFEATGAADDIQNAEVNWKDDVNPDEFDLPEINEEEITEILSNAKPITQGQNTLSRVPRLEENKNNKVHNESKIDELIKENTRLKSESNAMSNVIKEYKSSFTGLRKQFDELQTFNARLAYANSIFANSGYSTSEKVQIAERFDRTKNVEESKALFNTIIKEGKINVNKGFDKIKSTATKTAKPVETKKPLYESTEMKRNKVLAGIRKNEE